MFRPQPSHQSSFNQSQQSQQQPPSQSSFSQPSSNSWSPSSSGRPAPVGGFTQFGSSGNMNMGGQQQGQQQQQQQFGMGMMQSQNGSTNAGSGSVAGGGNYGDSSSNNNQRKKYLPGYLSGALSQQATPPPSSSDDPSSSSKQQWESPSKSSPSSSRLNQSLFGSSRSDGTPSKSLLSNNRTMDTGAGRQDLSMMEEDAPPIESLGEMDSSDFILDDCRPADSFSSLSLPSSSLPPSSSPGTGSGTPTQGYPITIFGFPPSALPFILSHFESFGPIISSSPGPESSNWLTITYQTPWSAARAQRKNGEVLGGVMMIGVKVDDEDALKRGLGTQENEVSSTVQQQTPVRSTTTSGVGKPIPVLGPQSAFKPVQTTPRRPFFGTPTTVATTPQQTTMFGEKTKAAQAGSGTEGQGKSLVGRVDDLVFGW